MAADMGRQIFRAKLTTTNSSRSFSDCKETQQNGL